MANGSKMPVLPMASTTRTPSLTAGATLSSGSRMLRLLTVSVAMPRAVSIGTPLPNKVPHERVNSVIW